MVVVVVQSLGPICRGADIAARIVQSTKTRSEPCLESIMYSIN